MEGSTGSHWYAYIQCNNKIPILKIYGSGSNVEDLQKKIRINSNRSIYYKGAKNHQELSKVFSRFSLFIFPSERESLGLVGLEAMASGVPVIGSSIGGIKSYLKNGYNGFLFDPGNAYDLKNKIELFYSLTLKDRKNMSENAKKIAYNYRSSNVSDDLYNQFKKLLKKHNSKNMDWYRYHYKVNVSL